MKKIKKHNKNTVEPKETKKVNSENICEQEQKSTEEAQSNAENEMDYKALYEALVKETEEIVAESEANKKALDEKTKALDEANDKYLRIVAEYDNFRKRSAKEKEGIYTDAYADALTEILPISDNLERATKAQGAEQIAEGLKMIMSQFADTLTKLGVEAYGETGEGFNPELHNAVMHIEDEAYSENVIAEVFQKGYKKGDKIIRHAMVKVAN